MDAIAFFTFPSHIHFWQRLAGVLVVSFRREHMQGRRGWLQKALLLGTSLVLGAAYSGVSVAAPAVALTAFGCAPPGVRRLRERRRDLFCSPRAALDDRPEEVQRIRGAARSALRGLLQTMSQTKSNPDSVSGAGGMKSAAPPAGNEEGGREMVLATSRAHGCHVHVMRLLPGDDLLLSLRAFIQDRRIPAAFVVTCVGRSRCDTSTRNV